MPRTVLWRACKLGMTVGSDVTGAAAKEPLCILSKDTCSDMRTGFQKAGDGLEQNASSVQGCEMICRDTQATALP